MTIRAGVCDPPEIRIAAQQQSLSSHKAISPLRVDPDSQSPALTGSEGTAVIGDRLAHHRLAGGIFRPLCNRASVMDTQAIGIGE